MSILHREIVPGGSKRRELPCLLKGLTIALSLLAASWPANGAAADAAEEDAGQLALQSARRFYLRGQFAEAEEAYAALAKPQPIAAALGQARCQAAVGEANKSAETLAAAAAQAGEEPASALLHAELARLAFESGEYPSAEKHAADALTRDKDCLLAAWITAELHRASGRLEEAAAGYKSIVEFYEQHDMDDADVVRVCGWAAAQHARWNRRKDDFGILVNDLYPLALTLDKDYWPAHLDSALLFLEKYNQAEAARSIKKALEINPQAAQVYAAKAQLALQNYDLDDAQVAIARALEINPNLVEAHRLQADSQAANFKLVEALAALEKARELNPLSEETLGRMAACYLTIDGQTSDGPETRFGKLRDEVLARNPAAGLFFFTVADQLSERRKFSASEKFYLEAIERMPQLVGPHAGLGMLYMRLGQEVEGEKLLNEAYLIDPFNLRVTNTLKVLEVLSGYAVIETEHFIVKFDRGQDEVLAQFSARYLEDEVYPVLTKQFGFEPKDKSLFEIFSKAKNTGGHGWFSARMVGLPYVGTVGACAGKMVAMVSPNSMDQKFNWARVLKHEFVHVLNLQQTNFNIPHWFTEALAVINEEFPRPQIWNQLLSARVPKRELFNLDNINLGFIRPSSSLDWQMAYCQAELYAEYMVARYGDDALAKMLSAYADNLETRAALKRCFDVEQEVFEQEYLEHLDKLVSELSVGEEPVEPKTLAELDKAHKADPGNPDIAAQLALAYLERKAYPKARELARSALEASPQHSLSSYVLARIHLLVGDNEEALELLNAALDREQPEEHVVSLLASLRLKAKQTADAADLYELMAQREPHSSRWFKLLAKVYLTTGDDERLAPVLEKLAAMDADDATIRKKLLQMALKRQDFENAARWANHCLQIDVQDADVHRQFGEALLAQEKFPRALEEFEYALRYQPGDKAARFGLAQALAKSGQPQQAKAALEALLKQSPDYPGAKELLEGLK
ncbi:MAG: tetratricopeptide repeat protein [Pirellulales bacterium]